MIRSCMWTALGPLLLTACSTDPICLPGGIAAVSVHALSAAEAKLTAQEMRGLP